MCFSATASFGLSAVLLVNGGYCVHRAVRRKREFLPLALVPIFFGFQQAFEGAVWLELRAQHSDLLKPFALGFLFFALIFWPTWIPLSTSFIEVRPGVRRFLQCAALVGLVGSLSIYLPIFIHPDYVRVTLVNHSLHYAMDELPAFALLVDHPRLYNALSALWMTIYVALVSTPMLISSNRRLAEFGVAVLLSAMVSHVFFNYAFESVWCYFAALMAAYLGYVFWKLPRPAKDVPALVSVA